MRLIVVVACHFDRPGKLCCTTRKRLGEVLDYYYQKESVVVVTGRVPYNAAGTSEEQETLASIMRRTLIHHEIPEGDVSEIPNGVDTPSEATEVARLAKEHKITDVYVISSNWYFWPGKLIWRRTFRESGIKLHFRPVYRTGGFRTRLTYLVIGMVMWSAFFLGIFPWICRKMTAANQGRKQGFTFNGCA